MRLSILRRVFAFITDLTFVFGAAVAFLLVFFSFTFRMTVLSILTHNFDKPFFISWSIPICVFLLGPLPLFLFLMLFSTSPGQFINGLKELDDRRLRKIDPIQAFLHAYALVPSFLLGFLPQAYAFFEYRERTVTQVIAGTKTQYVRGNDDSGDDDPERPWDGVV